MTANKRFSLDLSSNAPSIRTDTFPQRLRSLSEEENSTALPTSSSSSTNITPNESIRRLFGLCLVQYWMAFAEEMPTTAIGIILTQKLEVSPARQTLYYSAAFTCFSMVPLLAVLVEFSANYRRISASLSASQSTVTLDPSANHSDGLLNHHTATTTNSNHEKELKRSERIRRLFALTGVIIGGAMYMCLALWVRRPLWLFSFVTVILNLGLALSTAVLDGMAVEISNYGKHQHFNANDHYSDHSHVSWDPRCYSSYQSWMITQLSRCLCHCSMNASNVQNYCLLSRSLGSLCSAGLIIGLSMVGSSGIIAISALVYLLIAVPLIYLIPYKKTNNVIIPTIDLNRSATKFPQVSQQSSDPNHTTNISSSSMRSFSSSAAVDSNVGRRKRRLCSKLTLISKWSLSRLIDTINDLILPLWQPLIFLFLINAVPTTTDVFYAFIYSNYSFKNWQYRLFKFCGLFGALCGAFSYLILFGHSDSQKRRVVINNEEQSAMLDDQNNNNNNNHMIEEENDVFIQDDRDNNDMNPRMSSSSNQSLAPADSSPTDPLLLGKVAISEEETNDNNDDSNADTLRSRALSTDLSSEYSSPNHPTMIATTTEPSSSSSTQPLLSSPQSSTKVTMKTKLRFVWTQVTVALLGCLFIPVTQMGQRFEDGDTDQVRVFGLFSCSLNLYLSFCLCLYSGAATFSLMPQLAMAAALCPQGYETGVFGVFLGMSHLGALASGALSSYLLSNVFHVGYDHWDRLTQYFVLCLLCPFLPLAFLFV